MASSEMQMIPLEAFPQVNEGIPEQLPVKDAWVEVKFPSRPRRKVLTIAGVIAVLTVVIVAASLIGKYVSAYLLYISDANSKFKTQVSLATKTKPSATAASTDFLQVQTSSLPETTSFITTTIASSMSDASVVSSMSAISSASSINSIANLVTNTALRMSVKAVHPNPTQLEGTSTAKIHQLQQTITQVTQEVAATKSCACSSPGTKAHTLIKPVASQSIASYEPGKGTSQEPYKIASIQDLQKLRSIWKNNRGKYFIVTQNIDLSPIANFVPLPRFEGNLDGNNKTILNLKIDVTHVRSQTDTGLFETIERTGQVKNLGLENVLVMGEQNVGGLTGYHYGRIDNSYVTGQVLGSKKYNYVGGLVGTSDTGSRITDSYATAKVSGPYSVGGLVGILLEGTIQSCYATGTVSGIGNITNYANCASVIGGLVGDNYGTILSSYATGNVSGQYHIGGLVGFSSSGHHVIINNSYATGNVSGTEFIGGLVGDNQATITKCYAIGQVSGNDRLGGLVGENDGRIDNSYATGQVLGTDSSVGGLAGRSIRTGRITDSYATANVSGRSSVGGLVGNLREGTIQRCYATGTVSGIGSQIGGLVGGHSGTILSSYATGDVSGRYYIGGLVGNSLSGHHIKLNNSYATGNVSGRGIIGGLVGENGGTITKCYALGQLSGKRDRVGGLVGENTGRIEDSYGKQQFGTTNTLGAKTDTELKTPSTFTGWDTRLWKLTQNQYPKLKRLLN